MNYSFGSSMGPGMSSYNMQSGQGLNDSLSQSRPQYQPGYLLSLAQSQAPPTSGQRQEEPLLIPTRAKINHILPRNAPPDFGSESMFETASKTRHREADDEDGPPLTSVVDIIDETSTESRKISQKLFSVRKQNNTSAPTPSFNQRLFVTIFGYPTSRYSSTTAYFQSIAESGCTEPEQSLDVENAFTIGYNQPWEAARALRRNGEIISGDGGRWMVGVKWVDPLAAEQVLGVGVKLPTSVGLSPEASTASSQDAMDDILYDSSSSQLQIVGNSAQHGNTPLVGTPIRLAPSASAFRKAGNDVNHSKTGTTTSLTDQQEKSMLSQVSDLIFGW